MPVFAFETKPSIELLKFVKQTNERLQDNHIVKSPFEGKIYQVPRNHEGNKKLTYVVRMDPNYPPIFWVGLLGAVISIVLSGGVNAWAIFPLCIFASGLMWTKEFYIIFMGLGLRKAKHKHKLNVISKRETITRLLNVIIDYPNL